MKNMKEHLKNSMENDPQRGSEAQSDTSARRRFKVHVNLNLDLAAEVVVEAATPE